MDIIYPRCTTDYCDSELTLSRRQKQQITMLLHSYYIIIRTRQGHQVSLSSKHINKTMNIKASTSDIQGWIGLFLKTPQNVAKNILEKKKLLRIFKKINLRLRSSAAVQYRHLPILVFNTVFARPSAHGHLVETE